MSRKLHGTWVAICAAVLISGCAKKPEEAAVAAPASAPAAEPSTSAPAASAPAGPSTSAAPALDEKAAAIQAALAEDAIVSDPRGQWASAATASSTYASDKKPTATEPYAPAAATGAPNVEHYGDTGNAWTTETRDKGIEWLEVQFARPVNATQIRVRQNYGPGALIKVELIAEDGGKHAIWQGVDAQAYAPDTISWFDRSFDKTPYKVVGARLTLATNSVEGWNEIDAVQLLGD